LVVILGGMDMIDLTSACQRAADVLKNVTDDELNGPTPCESLSLRRVRSRDYSGLRRRSRTTRRRSIA